jgi:hypothetical protein
MAIISGMSELHEQFFKAGEAQLSELRGSVCQTADEHAALNVAISGKPNPPEQQAVQRFLAQARNQSRGSPGEMIVEEALLTSLVRFSEEDLIALRPYAALEPAAQVLIERLQRFMFTP